jgi:predicted ATPase/transcriptional regulator with XRE-family HTH domain
MGEDRLEGRSFGELLSSLRCAAGLTQEELASRSGLSADAIGLLERGARTTPRGTTVALLARALDLSPAQREVFAGAARRGTAGTVVEFQVPPDLLMQSTTFVGREQELVQVGAMLARPDVRLLTLTGPPGVGKTRLAMEAASRLVGAYRDGVTVVTLGAMGDPTCVMSVVRQAMGLRERGGEMALDTLAAHCRVRQQLLLLDNFEHLLAAGPELVELLARCPELRLLVTSRAALRVGPEHELAVLPLGEEEAVALFVERAEASAPGFGLTAANEAHVRAISRQLDGLPLSLELAAPWIRLLTPEQLLGRLDRRLELLVEGPRDRPERQRTLRAALDWSCELLEPEAVTLLRRLSVFREGAPLAGLESVCQAAGPLRSGVMRLLMVLAEHSLVHGQDAVGGGPRVAMLESVREYGWELLGAAGELEATAAAHLEYYVELAGQAGPDAGGGVRASWLERLAQEHDNVRAALSWAANSGHVEAGLRLSKALWSFWDEGGHLQEERAWLERLLGAPGTVHPAVRAEGLCSAGFLAWRLGSHDVALARYQEALAILCELGDESAAARVLHDMDLTIYRDRSRAEPD